MGHPRSPGRISAKAAPVAGKVSLHFVLALVLSLGISLALGASSGGLAQRVAGWVEPSPQLDSSLAALPLLDEQSGSGVAQAPTPAGATAPRAVAAPAAGGAASAAPSAGLSRAQAIALVQGRYRARVVRTMVMDDNGRRVYVFRLLSENGKVWTVRIDAQTGAEVP